MGLGHFDWLIILIYSIWCGFLLNHTSSNENSPFFLYIIAACETFPDLEPDRNLDIAFIVSWSRVSFPLKIRHNGVSNHRRFQCLFNRLFRHRSNKPSRLHATGLCVGNSPVAGVYPHKGPITRKMFPFDDIIMSSDMSTWWRITELSSYKNRKANYSCAPLKTSKSCWTPCVYCESNDDDR